MPESLEALIGGWQGLAVVSRFDKPTGSWIFICLHDDTLGPTTGGTRMAVYAQPHDALRDAMRLAEGMTHKWAALDFEYGGGKAVLAVPRPLAGEERVGLLRRYGRVVEALRGGFWTGEDLGTSTEDLITIAEQTRYVHGFDPADGSKLDPSPYTARGVLRGIEATLAQLFGDPSTAGHTVHAQGVGHVGHELCRLLAERGAKLLISDIDWERARRTATQFGGKAIEAANATATTCDVYAPCAVGATLNADTIPRLACRAVAGSANNQLAEPSDAERLLERGIQYVPDYIINAGGALAFGMLSGGTRDHGKIVDRVDSIGDTVTAILEEASGRGESPVKAARRRVDRALSRGRAEA